MPKRSIWRVFFIKSEGCGQAVLPDKLVLIEQKFSNENETFRVIFKQSPLCLFRCLKIIVKFKKIDTLILKSEDAIKSKNDTMIYDTSLQILGMTL